MGSSMASALLLQMMGADRISVSASIPVLFILPRLLSLCLLIQLFSYSLSPLRCGVFAFNIGFCFQLRLNENNVWFGLILLSLSFLLYFRFRLLFGGKPFCFFFFLSRAKRNDSHPYRFHGTYLSMVCVCVPVRIGWKLAFSIDFLCK